MKVVQLNNEGFRKLFIYVCRYVHTSFYINNYVLMYVYRRVLKVDYDIQQATGILAITSMY